MLVPPRDPKARRRYYRLISKARTAPPRQKIALLALARGLMVRVEGHKPQARPAGRGAPAGANGAGAAERGHCG